MCVRHIHLPERLQFTRTPIWIWQDSILISCLPIQIEKRDQNVTKLTTKQYISVHLTALGFTYALVVCRR